MFLNVHAARSITQQFLSVYQLNWQGNHCQWDVLILSVVCLSRSNNNLSQFIVIYGDACKLGFQAVKTVPMTHYINVRW